MGLAGPKNKQRISVDPQNRQWADDQDKVGYKMLKAMGWSSGKGLGKNEDGMAEHVKVSLKSNNLGVGADKKSIDNWMDNTFAFSSLLENLNKDVQDEEITTITATTTATATITKKKSKSKSGKKSGKDEVEIDAEIEEEVETTTENQNMRAITSNRLLHRRKFHVNKNVAAFDKDALNKILGVKSSAATPDYPDFSDAKLDSTDAATPASASTLALEKLKQDVTLNTRTATVDLANYFASKMPVALLGSGRQMLVSGLDTGKKRKTRVEEVDEEEEDVRPSFGGLGFGATKDTVKEDEEEEEEEEEEERPKMGLGGMGLGFGRFGGLGMSAFVKSSGEKSVTEQLKEEEDATDQDKGEKKKKKEKKDKKKKKAVDTDDEEESEKASKKNKAKKAAADDSDADEADEIAAKRAAKKAAKKPKKEEEEASEAVKVKSKKSKASSSDSADDKKKRKDGDDETSAPPAKKKAKRDKWGNRIA
ncbi:hypothetical protein BJ741DRAFT_708452 [Chytriomyces cf. hyalinus JEL632]|nr:hypothetical protein BJ741DRAFT_708452 [Chytriomyces cf. hyalinus JEL632]